MVRYTKRKYRRRRRTRRKYKRRWKRRRRVPRNRLTLGIPRSQTVKLRYTDTMSLNAGVDTLDYHTFSCNQAYDPDHTNSVLGHQPRFYDQYAQLYKRYTVLGSKITVRVVGPTTTHVSPTQRFGIITGSNTSPLAPNNDATAMMELPGLFGRQRSISYDCTKTKPLTAYWSLRKTKGITNKTDDVVSATVGGTGPSQENYFILWTGAAGMHLGDPGEVSFMIIIDYIIKFHDVQMNIPES